MADHNHWLAVCRATVSGHHSKTRKVWNGLSPRRRALILHAAEMKAYFCNYAWDEFSNAELRQLKRGIQKLRIMVSMFAGFNELDFRPSLPGMPDKPPINSVHNTQTAQERVQSSADLLKKIKALHVEH